MNQQLPFILSFYNSELVKKISTKFNIDQMDALRRFLFSKTYQMLADERLEMWEYSPIGIFDMWETEQVTGDPRNSLYIRRD